MDRVYLDHNATMPLRAEARAAMIAAMDVVGNPSSVHGEGRAARAILEKARGQVAQAFGCDPNDVVFTSGATESAAMAFPELAQTIMAEIEHDAVYRAGQYTLDIDREGRVLGTIGGGEFSQSMWDDLVAIQAANSETGVLQDTLALAQKIWATKRGVLVLVDAVQANGKVPFGFDRSGADFMLASAHKMGGPKGVGALVIKSGVEARQMIKGGGQEMGRRGGTENVIGIAGFGAAAQAAMRDLENGVWDRVRDLRDELETALAPYCEIAGAGAPRLPNTSCLITRGWKGETQVMQMDLAGFAISAGSACSSGKVKESRVLRAMGYDKEAARSAIRVSLGAETTKDEIERFAEAWIQAYKRHQARAV